MTQFKKSLFVFRRDLRITDNTGLNMALSTSQAVIPCFIFDPRQVGVKNVYRCSRAIQFMIESLKSLDAQLKKKNGELYIFSGVAEHIVEKVIEQENIDAVFVNRDYTPFSLKRDEAIEKICAKKAIIFTSYPDALINEPEDVKTKNGSPYSIFTAFYRRAKKIKVKATQKLSKGTFYSKPITDVKKISYASIMKKKDPDIHIHGGSENGLKILKTLKKFKHYSKDRNFPSIATTNLSAHLKFGTLSIRQTYHAITKSLGNHHPLVQQLYWRDFFTYVAYNSPFIFGEPYKDKYKKIWWSTNKKLFKAWCEGKTGFPIVDAGMRQLNQTGFMHNRVRMIVASFLTKDLHINWLWGEKYFAQQLVDYDPALNNGNWQWCASTGCDSQPYFRIFNPWLQQKKYDSDCVYIKTWIPELKNSEAKIIHSLFKTNSPKIQNYPRPIVDHNKESSLAKKLYTKN